jgi:hypothetical protein
MKHRIRFRAAAALLLVLLLFVPQVSPARAASSSEIKGEIADLKKENSAIQAEINAQAVWNATQEGVIRMQAAQLAQLYSMTKLVIPNGNVAPGWGPVCVVPDAQAATPAASGSTT